MEKRKKILAILLASCMTAMTAVPSFADETVSSEPAEVQSVTEAALEPDLKDYSDENFEVQENEASAPAADVNEESTPVADEIDSLVSDEIDQYQMEEAFKKDYLEEIKSEEDGQLSLMESNGYQYLQNGDIITEGGDYYVDPNSYGIIKIQTDGQVFIHGDDENPFVVETKESSEIVACRATFICEVPNVDLTLDNVAIAFGGDNYGTTSEQQEYDYDRSVIKFFGGENYLRFKGVNLIDYKRFMYPNTGKATISINRDNDGDGNEDALNIVNFDPDYPGKFYFFTQQRGSGIGGDLESSAGSYPGNYSTINTTNGRIVFGELYGDGTSSGPTIFAKSNQQGTMIGNSNNKLVPGNITVNGGILNLISNSNSVVFGGKAPATMQSDVLIDGEVTTANAAGIIFMNGGLLNINLDWAGAAVKSGGYYDATVDDKTGGYMLYTGGSVRCYKDLNAAQMWTNSGSNTKGYGVDFVGIGANVKQNTGYDGLSYIDPAEIVENCPPMYILRFNTKLLQNPDDNYLVETDNGTIYNGGMYKYHYINEDYYKTEQTSISTTYSNWEENSGLPETLQEHSLYFPMPEPEDGTNMTLRVNGEEFEYKFNPVLTSAGLKDTTKSYFSLINAWQTVTGGDTIDSGGFYAIVDEDDLTDHQITIATSEKVTLMTASQTGSLEPDRTNNVFLKVQDGVQADLRFEGVFMTYDGTVLDIPDGGTIELVGDANGLHGTSTAQDNPTLKVGGDLTVVKDSDVTGGYSIADMMTITAQDKNAAILVGNGGSFTQNETTLIVEKKGTVAGSAFGAVSAKNADVIVTKGALYVASDGGADVPAIYADTFDTTYYANVTAIAKNCPYALKSADYNLNGSLKFVGNGTTNQSAAYDLTAKKTLATIGDIACYKLNTKSLKDSEGDLFYVAWIDDNTNPDNRQYLGTLHELNYDSAKGFYLTVSSGIANYADRYLYFWFNTKDGVGVEDYNLLVNDDDCGIITWDDSAKNWTTELKMFNVSVSSTENGFIENTCPAGGTIQMTTAETVTKGGITAGTVKTNNGYILEDLRYFYTYAGTQSSKSIDITPNSSNPSEASFSITMPGNDIQIEAIWSAANTVTLNNTNTDDIAVDGLVNGGRYSGIVEFTVQCDEACFVTTGTGSDLTVIPAVKSGDSYTFTIDVLGSMTVNIVKRGDVNGDGSVEASDVNSILNHIKGKTLLTGLSLYSASADNSYEDIALMDVDKVIKSIYGIAPLSW